MEHDYDTIAKAIRLEIDEREDKLYIVFEVTSESFKQRIKSSWLDDLPLKLVNRSLVKARK